MVVVDPLLSVCMPSISQSRRLISRIDGIVRGSPEKVVPHQKRQMKSTFAAAAVECQASGSKEEAHGEMLVVPFY